MYTLQYIVKGFVYLHMSNEINSNQMNNFGKLIELNNNISIETKGRKKATKKEYTKALNKTFKGINATESNIHKSF